MCIVHHIRYPFFIFSWVFYSCALSIISDTFCSYFLGFFIHEHCPSYQIHFVHIFLGFLFMCIVHHIRYILFIFSWVFYSCALSIISDTFCSYFLGFSIHVHCPSYQIHFVHIFLGFLFMCIVHHIRYTLFIFSWVFYSCALSIISDTFCSYFLGFSIHVHCPSYQIHFVHIFLGFLFMCIVHHIRYPFFIFSWVFYSCALSLIIDIPFFSDFLFMCIVYHIIYLFFLSFLFVCIVHHIGYILFIFSWVFYSCALSIISDTPCSYFLGFFIHVHCPSY